MWKKVYEWLDERLGLNDIYTNLLDRPEPKGNWWNTLGSASLFLFVLQGLTGIFLTVYYTPSPDHAYDSVQYIMEGVAFGWLIRGIHHWGATLMVIVVFIHHLARICYRFIQISARADMADRHRFIFSHTGHGLHRLSAPMESTCILGNTVGTQIAGSVPFIGEFILKVLRGGPDLSALTLQRFFSAHIWMIPAVLAGFIGIHLYLIIKHGESHFPTKED